MRKPKVGNYIQLHREFSHPIRDDWAPCCLKDSVLIKVLEVFCQEDPSNVLIRISISRDNDFEMTRDSVIKYNLRDLFLGETLKEVDWFPSPISQNWLLSNGFTYSD